MTLNMQGTGRKKGKNIVWTEEMDKRLIWELVHQANEGYKVDKGFKDHAYTAACSTMNLTFNLSLTRNHIVNRLKTIKQKHRFIQEMLSKSGFSWNPVKKMVECSDTVWATCGDFNDNVVGEDCDDISTGSGSGSAPQQGNTSSQKPALGKRNHGSSKPPARRSKKPKGAELVAETMAAVATNMARLADAYEKSKPCIDYNELYKAVMDGC
ncbi:hypothetical protein RHMOL_Rhmol06G0163900 [Rhododendron molle]|uniref:Uncharacterized protein n=1 Tax=Rhododendron molle TaxID=49168 RepID=A0ACC0ND41_RHOML|nr:hypothetical protein RHMOL_Rhmol06G0163900 [Rhododendron molle]